MKNKNKLAALKLLAGVGLCTLAGSANAEGFEYSGAVRIGASNSDNILLASDPFETDETIFQISPSINLDYENQRMIALLRYQFDWYRYSDLDRTNKFHLYDASLIGELVDDTLFIEIGGSRSQSVIDPDGTIPHGNLPISGNLTDRDEYFVNPRFEKTFGRSVTTRVSYRYADVQFDDDSLQNNTNEDASVGIENYQIGQGMTWAVRYDWRETEYDLSLPWEFEKASAELGFWANGSTRVFASGGKESAWDDPIDRSLQDTFWEAGFAYRNGDKLSAEFAAGERSFGSSWRGNLDFSFQRGTLAFSYAETPTTSGAERFSRGSLLNPEEPNDFLARPGSAQRFVLNRGQASLALSFRRTTLNFVVYDEERTGRFNAAGIPLGDETQNGVSVLFSWQAGGRTEFFANGSINTRETESTGAVDFMNASVGANYQVGSKVLLSLSYNYSEQDPDDSTLTGRDYVANVVSFFITYSF